MDFISRVDGPSEGIPRVLACFSNNDVDTLLCHSWFLWNLLRGEPLNLVDGGQSQWTFFHIKEAIEVILLMIENPSHANENVFNAGNPSNEVTKKQLAEMMIKISQFLIPAQWIFMAKVTMTTNKFLT